MSNSEKIIDYNHRNIPIFTGQPLGDNFLRGSIERCVEDIKLKGYTIIEDKFNFNVESIKKEIDNLYVKELSDFGYDNLLKINDIGVVRNPIFQSKLIRQVAFHEIFRIICKNFFGSQYILHVNRAVVSDPSITHPANVWHREPPYQNYISDNPFALTVIYFPDGSNQFNSGVEVLPGSHKWTNFPSDDYVLTNAVTPNIRPGEAIVIDSSLFHRGGVGASERRRSIVTIFTSPLIKQQTNIAEMVVENYPDLLGEFSDSEFLYGVTTKVHKSDTDYRNNKLMNKVKINE